jgi:hypothetical protein
MGSKVVMTIKQSVFRDAYRLKIETWYSATAHVVLIYAVGIGALCLFPLPYQSPDYLVSMGGDTPGDPCI